MAKQRTTPKEYVEEIHKMLEKEYGERPYKLEKLVSKTAMDMLILDKISHDIVNASDLVTLEIGSMGQQKPVVNPLLPYYDKMSARVTDDLYNLGLTARKQAVKVEDPGKVDDEDPMKKFYQDARK
jgi:hypothetical protein